MHSPPVARAAALRRRTAIWGAALFVLASGIAASTGRGAGGAGAARALTPAQPAAVGVATATFVDTHRTTAANGACPALRSRTLITTIWYPATSAAGSSTPLPGAPPARADAPYPLIVFAHGFSATPQGYEQLLASWASAGFVVAAPLFPLSSALSRCGANAGDALNQPGDMSDVITGVLRLSARSSGPLAGLVDAHEVGAAGHSDGAITTLGLVANTCCHDPRVKAAMIMAGTPEAFPHGHFDFALAPPLLLVHGTDDALVPYGAAITVFNRTHGPKGLLTVVGGDHGSAASVADAGAAGVDFFDAYLRGQSVALGRLRTDVQPGVSTLHLAAAPGSRATLPTVPVPVLHLQATVTPQRGLVSGQSVTITWRGYSAGKVVNVLECNAGDRKATSASACDFANAKILQPDPTGAGSVTMPVVEGKVGNGVCNAAHSCFVIVNNASSTDPAGSVLVPITFAR
jgi:fermentation-respiration switch protein FrsA (DUF1100 family)